VAETAFSNPAVVDEIVKAGVDMSFVRIDYKDGVDSGKH
jgi:hypothetical protein